MIAIFLITAMFSLGLDLTLGQIALALRNRRLVAKGTLINFVVVPLLAIGITRLIPMDNALRMGIVLYALSAGTEGGPKFVQMVKGNTAFAFGLLVIKVQGVSHLNEKVHGELVFNVEFGIGTPTAFFRNTRIGH